jgi:hypothetical protein
MEMTLPSTAATMAPAPQVAFTPKTPSVSEEQLVYAKLLDIGMKAGMAMLLVTFAIYVLGFAQPVVALEDLPKYWSMPVGKYLAATGVGTGWSWVGLIARGDFMNFVGIAFLSAVTIVCYLRILPIPARNGERLFSAILALETVVLILGASGILSAGH